MTLMNLKSKTKLAITPEERHRQLISASNDYMAEKISHSEFRKVESVCMTDYDAVTLELGKVSRILRSMSNRLNISSYYW
jgi:chromosome condensin MukBEF ATPase and DNA-binding subunit MukB